MIPRSMLTTPRPVPDRRLPAAAGSLAVLLGLPVFAAAGWSLGAWGLGAALWFAGEVVAFGIARMPLGANNLALAAGLLFAAAYSLELGLSLLLYFAGGKT